MEKTINLNTAQLGDLANLPGVGPVMAERIIAARPYQTIEDLRTVNGIGPTLFNRLAPLVTLDEPEEDEEVIYLPAETPIEDTKDTAPDEAGTTIPPEPLPQVDQLESPQAEEPGEATIPKDKAIIPVNNKEEGEQKPTKRPKPVTWGRVILLVIAFSLGSFIFAVLLTLGIIGTINNGIRYASPEDLQTLNRQQESLGSQIGIVLQDIESLRSRLDNLEPIPAQMQQLEAATEQISEDMATTVEIVTGMETKIDEIETRTTGFQAFLDGLADLLASITTPNLDEIPQEVE